jgi:predicted nucleic acid-binding protein
VDIVVSPPILSEYRQVGEILSAKCPGVDVEPIAALLAVYANVVDAPDRLPEQVCRDVDDDKFLTRALAAEIGCIISGDADHPLSRVTRIAARSLAVRVTFEHGAGGEVSRLNARTGAQAFGRCKR